MARLIWAPSALDDLESLVEFIARDAPVAARRFAEKVFHRVEILQHFPDSGARIPEDHQGVYREVLQGPYRIIYRVENSVVYIVAVRHGAQLLDAGDLS